MNSIDIECILRQRGIRNFDGMFSADTLPADPHLLICNTDPSDRPGEHWISICVEEGGRGEFFDSFGRPPNEVEQTFRNVLKCHLSPLDIQ